METVELEEEKIHDYDFDKKDLEGNSIDDQCSDKLDLGYFKSLFIGRDLEGDLVEINSSTEYYVDENGIIFFEEIYSNDMKSFSVIDPVDLE